MEIKLFLIDFATNIQSRKLTTYFNKRFLSGNKNLAVPKTCFLYPLDLKVVGQQGEHMIMDI